MRLRTILTAALAMAGFMALITAGALVLITSHMRDAVALVTAATENVHVVEDMEVDILAYHRATDRMTRTSLEQRIRSSLPELRKHLGSPEETELLAAVEQRIDTYLQAGRSTAGPRALLPDPNEAGADEQFGVTFEMLERLVDINVAQTRTMAEQAMGWNRAADRLGIGVAIVLVICIGSLVVWLHTAAFRSVFHLGGVMRRFAGGEKSVRASETGPLEIRDMARAFNDMASALDRQRTSQFAFLAGVAHDVRNPLTALNVSLAAIHPEGPLPPQERLREVLSRTKRQVDSVNRMVGDLLDATRVEAGRLDLRFEDVDIREIARETMDLFQGTSPLHEIRLLCPEEPVWVHGDSTRIEQVLSNLVSNAIKFSPQGGLVEIAVRIAGEEAVISVSDRGTGISSYDRQFLFEPFARAETSRTSAPGAGLGLWVVRRIVDAHGGQIDVESAEGHGSTFRVHLPASVRGAAMRAQT